MKIGCRSVKSHCIPFPSSDTKGDKTGSSGKLRSPGCGSGLLKLWGNTSVQEVCSHRISKEAR